MKDIEFHMCLHGTYSIWNDFEMMIITVKFTAQYKMICLDFSLSLSLSLSLSVCVCVCVSVCVSQGVNSVKRSQYGPPYTDKNERFNQLKESSDAQLHFNPDYTETLILSKYSFFKKDVLFPHGGGGVLGVHLIFVSRLNVCKILWHVH